MVAVAELDLEFHAREERRRWPEYDLVAARLEVTGERGDAPVGVRLTRCEEFALSGQLDAHPRSGLSSRRVEHVGRDGCAHPANLRACTR